MRRNKGLPIGAHLPSAQTLLITSPNNPPPCGYLPDDDDYIVHSFLVSTHYDNLFKDDKYFTLLLVSVSPEKTVTVLMQVDSAAMCINTLPSSVYKKILNTAPPQQSYAKIFPYSGKAIHPIGKVSLACE